MKENKIGTVDVLQFDLFRSDNLCHFVTTRQGGVSEGEYAASNMGNLSDDNPDHVYENRNRLTLAIGIDSTNLFIPHQTHGDKVCIIDETFLSLSHKERENFLNGVDALITDKEEVGIGVTTADCVPVLVFDPEKRVFAAIHAGWKGTVNRIVSKTIRIMELKFNSNPQNLLAAIGPSISPEKFEVGDEVGIAFKKADFDLSAISFRSPETGKLHIDLWEANKTSLIKAGVLPENIEIARLCTYCDSERFFSARRQTIHSGRMLSGGIIRK